MSRTDFLAVWILPAKLPNSNLNFAVDVGVDLFLLFFSKEKGPKKYPPKNPPQNSPGNSARKIPLGFLQKPILDTLVTLFFFLGFGPFGSHCTSSGRKERLKIKFLGRIFSEDFRDPDDWDIPDPGTGMSRTKTSCKTPFSVVLDTERPGRPAIRVGKSRDLALHTWGLRKLYARDPCHPKPPLTKPPFPIFLFFPFFLMFQERTRHINLRKIPGTPAGCPWDTRRDKQVSTGRCPRNFLLFTIEELPFLPGHRPGVPGTPERPGDFQKIYVIFSYVPFLLPNVPHFPLFRPRFCCLNFFLCFAACLGLIRMFRIFYGFEHEENWDDWLCEGWVWEQPKRTLG